MVVSMDRITAQLNKLLSDSDEVGNECLLNCIANVQCNISV